jgi:hypothetical protein
MPNWEYSSFVAAPPRLIDRTDNRDDVVVLSINAVAQDHRTNPVTPVRLLNDMGREGWELVSVNAIVPPSPNSVRATGIWEYLLKRQTA